MTHSFCSLTNHSDTWQQYLLTHSFPVITPVMPTVEREKPFTHKVLLQGDQPWSLSVSPSPFFLILMPRKYTELKLVVCFYICIKMTSLLNTGPEFPGLMKLVQIVCVKASEMLTALENFSPGNIPDC